MSPRRKLEKEDAEDARKRGGLGDEKEKEKLG
jgi:hypothetical protein